VIRYSGDNRVLDMVRSKFGVPRLRGFEQSTASIRWWLLASFS